MYIFSFKKYFALVSVDVISTYTHRINIFYFSDIFSLNLERDFYKLTVQSIVFIIIFFRSTLDAPHL